MRSQRLSHSIERGLRILDHEQPRMLVRDTLSGQGSHTLTWRFHLDPAVTPECHGDDVRLTAGGREVWLRPQDGPAGMTLRVEDGWVSPSYGVRVPAKVLLFEARADVPLTVSFLFTSTL